MWFCWGHLLVLGGLFLHVFNLLSCLIALARTFVLTVSFVLLPLDLFCSSFSRFLRWKLRLMIWDFFSNICIYWYTFPSEPALATSYRFWYVVSSFSFISMYFCLFSYFLFDLWLSQNVLFSFQVFWLFSYLSVIALYFWFYSFVIREHNLHYVKVCFMAQDVVCFVVCCMNTWKECEFCCLGVEYSINTNYILLLMVVLVFFLYPYGFSVWPVVEKGMLKFSFIIVNLSIFSFNSIMFLLHIFTAIFVYTGTVCLGRLSLLTLYNVLLCLWWFSFLQSLLYMIFT